MSEGYEVTSELPGRNTDTPNIGVKWSMFYYTVPRYEIDFKDGSWKWKVLQRSLQGGSPPPSGSSVDVEAAFATAVLETVKLTAPPRERRLMPGRG